MAFVIVPLPLQHAIDAAIEKALASHQEARNAITPENRKELFRQLLVYYDEHGNLPDFTIQKTDRKEP